MINIMIKPTTTMNNTVPMRGGTRKLTQNKNRVIIAIINVSGNSFFPIFLPNSFFILTHDYLASFNQINNNKYLQSKKVIQIQAKYKQIPKIQLDSLLYSASLVELSTAEQNEVHPCLCTICQTIIILSPKKKNSKISSVDITSSM